MVLWIAYLVQVYNLPPSLVVNIDQRGIHLVPIVRERTWEKRGPRLLLCLVVMIRGPLVHVFLHLQMAHCFHFNSFFKGQLREFYQRLVELE